tara:strand:+ start:185 stop:550 length:366 start_codon:yes stop_codon:yes gene_type:complete
VLNRIAKIVMLIVMLATQVGEAFAFSAMPCADDDTMVTMGKMMDHSKQAMNDDNKDESVDTEKCCQKDCCCPMGLISLAVILDTPFKTPFDFKTAQPLDSDSDIIDIFLNQPQRPPKFNLS